MTVTSDTQAKRIVVGALVVTVVTTTVKSFREHGSPPPLRVLVGGFFAGAVLAMLAEVSPPLASSLAVLVLITALLTSGGVADVIPAVLGNP